MKTTVTKILCAGIITVSIIGCNKGDRPESGASKESPRAEHVEAVSDSVSSVATMHVDGKQFIKTAGVNMEVQDVYKSTISIENKVKEYGGFVSHSNLQSNVLSEDTYNTSDANAVLVKKYQMENTLQVNIPTEKLGEFLQDINNKSLFLNSRVINAEDVTANIKFAEMEAKRVQQTQKDIQTLKNSQNKVVLSDENRKDENEQKSQAMQMTDKLKYSQVDIYLKEPKLSIAQIPVTNTQNIDNQYKINFWYDAKNALVEGYYLIQTLMIGLLKIWPLLIIGALVYYWIKKRKTLGKKPTTSQES